MPAGKPAGIRCVNLDAEDRCIIHGRADYPDVCRNFKASEEMCGNGDDQAREYLTALEALTKP